MQRRLEQQGSQHETVKAVFLSWQRLTQRMLLKLYGGNKAWRLGGIVWRLERDKKEPLRIDRCYSGRNRVATYWLAQDEQPGPQQLGLPL